ncbi:MAG: HAD-IA family hydrolase [Butyrivibrio sp.]|nr:HAD-IA family hydrolase [Butyrivibrio sp.]
MSNNNDNRDNIESGKKNVSMVPGYKRVLALVALALIFGLIIAFLLVALFGGPESKNVFVGLAGAIVAVPILFWLLLWSAGAIFGWRTVASFDVSKEVPLSQGSPERARTSLDNTSASAYSKYGNVIVDGKIDTIVFDIGNVLTDFAYEKFIASKGYDKAMVERISKASVLSEDWVEYDKGDLTNDEIVQRFVDNDPEIEDDLRKVFANIDGIILKREKTIPWIRALKTAGYKVLYLSNFSKQALEGCPDAMAFLEETDGGILSYRDHVVKPGDEIYHLLEERYDLVPEKTVFIDDTKANIDTCLRLGWEGIVYKDFDQAQKALAAIGVKY